MRIDESIRLTDLVKICKAKLVNRWKNPSNSKHLSNLDRQQRLILDIGSLPLDKSATKTLALWFRVSLEHGVQRISLRRLSRER